MKKNYLSRLLHYKSIIAITAAVAMVATPIVSYSAVGSSAEKLIAEEAKEEKNATPADAENSTDNAEVDVDGDVVNDIESKDNADEANTDTASKNEEIDASKTADTETETEKKQAVEDAIKKLKEYEAGLKSGTLTESELSDISAILEKIADYDFTELGISEEDNAFLESFAKALDEYTPETAAIKLDSVDIDINEWGSIRLDSEYSIIASDTTVPTSGIVEVNTFYDGSVEINFQGKITGTAQFAIAAKKNDETGTCNFSCDVNVSDIEYMYDLTMSAGSTISISNIQNVNYENISKVYEKNNKGLIKIEDTGKAFEIESLDKDSSGKTKLVIETKDGKKYSLGINICKFETIDTLYLSYYETKELTAAQIDTRIASIRHCQDGDGSGGIQWNPDTNVFINARGFGDGEVFIYAYDESGQELNIRIPIMVDVDCYSTNNITMNEGDTLVLSNDLKIDGSKETFDLSGMERIDQGGNDDDDDESIELEMNDDDGALTIQSWRGSGTVKTTMYYGNRVDKTYCVTFNIEVKPDPDNVMPALVFDNVQDCYWLDLWEVEDTNKEVPFTEKTFKTKAGKDIQLLLMLYQHDHDEDDDSRQEKIPVTIKYIFSDSGKEETRTVEIKKDDKSFSTITPPDTSKAYTCTIDTTESEYGKPVLIITCTADKNDNKDNNNNSSSGSSSGGSNTGWVKDSKGWRYRNSDGILAQGTTVTDADGNKVEKILWQKAGNGYYAFGSDGYLLTGWIYDRLDNKWYYCDESSGKKYGWLYEAQDGYWYYLLPSTGEALTGWQNINGKDYYFAGAPSASTYSYDSSTGFWIYSNIQGIRPFGSMYANTVTPDNYAVDANGAKIR